MLAIGFPAHTPLPIISPLRDTPLQCFREMATITIKQLKVLRAVVIFFTVLVMNHLALRQVATEFFFHYKAMLKNVFGVLPRIRVAWAINLNVAVLVLYSPTFPFWVSCAASWPCALALYPVLFTDFVDQLGGYSRVYFHRQLVSDLLLCPPISDQLTYLGHWIINVILCPHGTTITITAT